VSVEVYRGGTLVVRVRYLDDGRLSIEGHDLGGHPVFEEYEYDIRIAPDQFPALRAALAADPAVDVLDLVVAHGETIVRRGEIAWLKAHDIAHDLDTWGH
jgi:hypothetical protein